MFTISTRLRYGLLALIAIVEDSENGPVRLGAVADKLGMSFKYLENIFKLLKKAGIVLGQRGPEGGYLLAKPAEALRLDEIFVALEGALVEVECLEAESLCSRLELCPVRTLWQDFHGVVEGFLMERTLREIMEHPQDSPVHAHAITHTINHSGKKPSKKTRRTHGQKIGLS